MLRVCAFLEGPCLRIPDGRFAGGRLILQAVSDQPRRLPFGPITAEKDRPGFADFDAKIGTVLLPPYAHSTFPPLGAQVPDQRAAPTGAWRKVSGRSDRTQSTMRCSTLGWTDSGRP